MPDTIMKCERTDHWIKMRPSRARSSAQAASCHILSSVDFITSTFESEFLVHTEQRLQPSCATHWRQHSLRGFFAGVVRKKLGLDLRSEKVDGDRVLRIVQVSTPTRPSAARGQG